MLVYLQKWHYLTLFVCFHTISLKHRRWGIWVANIFGYCDGNRIEHLDSGWGFHSNPYLLKGLKYKKRLILPMPLFAGKTKKPCHRNIWCEDKTRILCVGIHNEEQDCFFVHGKGWGRGKKLWCTKCFYLSGLRCGLRGVRRNKLIKTINWPFV